MPAAVLHPLSGAQWLTRWSLDVPAVAVAALAATAYLLGVRSLGRRGQVWPWARTLSFLLGGLAALLAVTCSALGTYSRVLFTAAAAQDVLLLTLVPVGLTLGRPVALLHAVRTAGREPPHPHGSSGLVVRVLTFPLVGSVLAVAALLAVYLTGWDAARLRHPALFALTQLVLLGAGCLFLWPLLGVDAVPAAASYPVRALVTLLDGLLDALPGLAVLGAGHLVAADYYASLGRTWGPSPAQDQQLGGTLMIALSELVGLPALLVLLVQWVRRDARDASAVDVELDRRAPDTVIAAPDRQRPWWEVDPGPLAERAQRQGWAGADREPPPD